MNIRISTGVYLFSNSMCLRLMIRNSLSHKCTNVTLLFSETLTST